MVIQLETILVLWNIFMYQQTGDKYTAAVYILCLCTDYSPLGGESAPRL